MNCRIRASATGFATVLRSLRRHPWQTQRELDKLLGYCAAQALHRLMARGMVRRRVGERPRNAYEYAIREVVNG